MKRYKWILSALGIVGILLSPTVAAVGGVALESTLPTFPTAPSSCDDSARCWIDEGEICPACCGVCHVSIDLGRWPLRIVVDDPDPSALWRLPCSQPFAFYSSPPSSCSGSPRSPWR